MGNRRARIGRDKGGMTLVQVLISAGLMGGLALALSQIMQNAARGTKGAEALADYATLKSMIQQLLQNKGTCKDTLGGQTVGTSTTSYMPIRFLDPAGGGSVFVAGPPSETNPFRASFKIASLGLKVRQDYGNGKYFGEILLSIQKSAEATGARTRDDRFFLTYSRDTATQQITECVGGERLTDIEQAVCDSLGFDYDEAKDPRCAARYVRDLTVVASFDETGGAAVGAGPDTACPDGYGRHGQDLNQGSEGKWIYACISRYPTAYGGTAQVSGPLTDVDVVHGGSSSVSCPSGYTKVNVDLNWQSGGEFIYFCITRAPKSPPKVVEDLTFVAGDSDGIGCPADYAKVNVDLNKGASGKYIYLCKKLVAPPAP
jgi:type II secretory pathway pseudopilin PulG